MRRSYAIAGGFLVGLLVGAAGSSLLPTDGCRADSLINPDYACSGKHAIRKTSYATLVAQLQRYLDDARAQGLVQVASVYFRDLRGGPVWGVAESENFAPASLLKLPLVMAYYSLNETMPGLVDQAVVFEKTRLQQYDKLRQTELDMPELEEGKSYRVEELARRAIVYSDNVAYYLLVDHINRDVPGGREFGTRVFQELGVIDPRRLADEVVTARVYSGLFRLLYNVAYLDAEASAKILGWLAEAEFADGLAAGVPQGIPVANKYGERGLPDGTQHLHDCGIIYFPGNPYILCVMTKGRSWNELGRVIAHISKMVWTEVESRRQ